MAHPSDLSASEHSLSFLAGLSSHWLQSGSSDSLSLLQHLLAETGRFIAAGQACFFSYRALSPCWQQQASWQATPQPDARPPVLTGEQASALAAQLAGLTPGTACDARKLANRSAEPAIWPELQSQAPLQTWILPVCADKRLNGFLALRDAPPLLSLPQLQALTSLASWLGQIADRLQHEHLHQHQIKSQALISQISSRFVQLHEARLEQAIILSLEEIGAFFQADRAYLFRYDPLQDTYSLSHQWCARGIPALSPEMQQLSFAAFPWWAHSLKSQNQVLLPDVSQMPPEARREQAVLQRQGIQSLLCRPIQLKQMPYGLIGVDAVRHPARWTAEDIESFQRLSVLMGDVLFRHQAEQTLQAYAGMQRLLMQLATHLIHLPLADIDGAMQEALKELGAYLGAEKAYIFDYLPASGTYHNSYIWSREGGAALPKVDTLTASELGNWHLSQRPYVRHSAGGLQADAPLAAFVNAEKIQSLVSVPVRFQSESLGFVAFATLQNRQHYSSQQISILGFFAQMLANIRQREQLQHSLLDSRNQAEQASQAKSAFLANISHEIRTPLNGVLGFLEMLRATPLNPVQSGYLDHAAYSADSLLRLLNDILDFVRLGSDQLPLHQSLSDLPALIQQTLDALEAGALKKQLVLKLQLPEKLPAGVMVDPLRLKQILMNLVGNAIKFTEQGGVTVALHFSPDAETAGQGCFELVVEDTGPGIAPADQAKLFQPFSQVDTSATRRFGGSGLGLVISRQLAERMGASLELESTPGKGSRFSLKLTTAFEWQWPATASAPLQPAPLPESLVLSEAPLQVLMVEDHPINRQLLRAMLERLLPAAAISEAFNGAEAVQAAETSCPDLILMDIQMPVMDGYEATRRIRQMHAQVPIVALTAATLDAEQQRSREAGMNAYLSKPFSREQLYSLLKTLTLAVPAPVHFDAPALLERLDGDLELAHSLVAQALEMFQAEPLNLPEALDAAAAEALRQQAHRIKGMAANLSLLALQQQSQQLEQLARRCSEDPGSVLPEALQAAARAVQTEMALLHEIALWPGEKLPLRV